MTRRLTTALVAAALAAGLASCGAADEEEAPVAAESTPAPVATPPLPEETGPEFQISPEVRRALADGGIAVVDLANRATVEPRTLRANKEQVLRDLEWRGWGGRRAVGRGTVETLDCQPNCGRGLVSESEATITLTRPRVCGSRRFYSEARLVYEDVLEERERESATYLRPPC